MKHNANYINFSPYTFTGKDDITFSVNNYSFLKFGSRKAAKMFAEELAHTFFLAYAPYLLSNSCVVIPSPYNYVKNAASILTELFVNELNNQLVSANGEYVEIENIRRYVSYISDYGFLSKEDRRKLIDNDTFFINMKFLKGKTIIFIDDIRISGTHEEKIIELLEKEGMKNNAFFLYIAQLQGNVTSPDIESFLNLSGIDLKKDFIEICKNPDNELLVRPIKYIMSMNSDDFSQFMSNVGGARSMELYYKCLGEGYYRVPAYQNNFNLLRDCIL